MVLNMAALFMQGVLSRPAAAREFVVALAPLEVRGNENPSFVCTALMTMLPTRISEAGKINVLDSELLLRHLPRRCAHASRREKIEAAKKSGADFLLDGSIEKKGDSLSITASLIPLSRGGSISSIEARDILMDNLIPATTSFALKVRSIIGGSPLPPDPPPRLVQKPPQQRKRGVPQEIPDDMT